MLLSSAYSGRGIVGYFTQGTVSDGTDFSPKRSANAYTGSWSRTPSFGQVDTYGCTGWKGKLYANTNYNIYKLSGPSASSATAIRGLSVTGCREMGTFQNCIVYSNADGANVGQNTLYFVALDAQGDQSYNSQMSLPLSYNGIITTNHPDYIGFLNNVTLTLLKVNYDASGHITGHSGVASTHTLSGGYPDNSYNGTGGFYDVYTGTLGINRWNDGSHAVQVWSGPSVTANNLTQTLSGNFSFQTYHNTNQETQSIGMGADPWTGRIMHCYHGDGKIVYNDTGMSGYPVETFSTVDVFNPGIRPLQISAGQVNVNDLQLSRTSANVTGTGSGGLFVSPQGHRVFLYDAADVYQHNLSTDHDVSTLTYTSNYTTNYGNRALSFSSDGVYMFTVDETPHVLHKYELSTPWNVSSASYVSATTIPKAGNEDYPHGVTWSPDGKKAVITWWENTSDLRLHSYNLTTGWDFNTATRTAAVQMSGNSIRDSAVSDDGTFMAWVQEGNANTLYVQELTTAWDVSTATNYATYPSFSGLTSLNGIHIGGKYLYLSGNSTLEQYSL